MEEPTIVCPHCKSEIRLTESLAGPLLDTVRHDYEERLRQKDADVAKREDLLREREEQVRQAEVSVGEEIAAKVKEQSATIAADEARKAKQALSLELQRKDKEISELGDLLKQREEKLGEVQDLELQLLRERQGLKDAKRELDLTVEKRIQESLAKTRAESRKEVEEELKQKIQEREETISSMQRQIEDLKRRAEQGSQQLQGEVQELELESILRATFPGDTIDPVPKGEHGGDVLQRVIGPSGLLSGTILWESKRTRNWSDEWLTKLRDDQRTARAELAVIVSKALPKHVDLFDLVDGIWVGPPRVLIPLATILRQSLIAVSLARQTQEGKQTKMDQVYEYLTGPLFRQRVQAVLETYSAMASDLKREKKLITKQWAKREMEIDRVMRAASGMWGDLQGIAGRTLPEIEGLDLPALESGRGDGEDTETGAQ